MGRSLARRSAPRSAFFFGKRERKEPVLSSPQVGWEAAGEDGNFLAEVFHILKAWRLGEHSEGVRVALGPHLRDDGDLHLRYAARHFVGFKVGSNLSLLKSSREL